MPTITICSSVNFYREVIKLKAELEKQDFKVIIPDVAERMEASGDYEVSHYKTWFADPNDYDKKAALMLGHFAEVAKGDAILVLNNEKHGVTNYIGGNVLMEMAIAFYLKKPIYIANEIPLESSFQEEILGVLPIVLHGDIKNFSKVYNKNS
jgi:hypothetical protein